MIKLNLLDESEIPQDTRDLKMKPKMSLGSSKVQKWLILGPVITGVVYLCFLGFYFIGVRGPVNKLKHDIAENNKLISQLKPKVKESQEASE